MALAFFRKRRKMIVIIMAVLMVSFLIGFQGFEMIFSRRRGDQKIATTALGPLTWTEVHHAARDDMEKLSRLGLGRSGGMGRPTEMEYLWLSSNAAKAPEAYALLLREARRAGVQVGQAEVTQFLDGLKPAGVTREEFISDLTTRDFPHEQAARQLIARWLTVVKNYGVARAEVPSSEREVKAVYRDLNEKIDLAVVKLSAEAWAPKAPTFTDKQIQEQFDGFRELEEGAVTEKSPLGFGYRLKDRVKIDYLFIRREVLQRVIRPREDQVIGYYNEHRHEFIQREAVPETQPASGPSTSPASSPATTRAATEPAPEPKRYRSRQMTFSEAEPEIIRKLSDAAVEQAMQGVLAVVEGALERLGRESAPTDPNLFDAVRRQMLSRAGADRALAIPVKTAGIEQMPLDKAMAALAERARLDAICFPWGAHGRYRVDPKVKVTLGGARAAAEMPLGQALDEIARQVFGTAGEAATKPSTAPATAPATAATSPAEAVVLTWQACQGLPGVLFAGGTIDFLPVRTGRTELLDRVALARHEMLGLCFASREGGAALVQLAFEAEAFRKDDRRDAGLLKTGYIGRPMYATGLLPGRLVWRLADAVASCAPEKITDDLRERIVKDLALKAGYDAARKKADQILAAAEKDGLAKAAGAAGLKVEETHLTARKRLIYPPWQFLEKARQFGYSVRGLLPMAMMQKPVDFEWNVLEGLELDEAQRREELMKSAFALAPKDVEPKDGAYPAKPYALAVVALPSKRLVAVVQRVDFRPVVAAEYETDGSRERIARYLADIREWEVRRSWFSADDIRRRLDYKAVPSPGR